MVEAEPVKGLDKVSELIVFGGKIAADTKFDHNGMKSKKLLATIFPMRGSLGTGQCGRNGRTPLTEH